MSVGRIFDNSHGGGVQPRVVEGGGDVMVAAHAANQSPDEIPVTGVGNQYDVLALARSEVVKALDGHAPREFTRVFVSPLNLRLVDVHGEGSECRFNALELHRKLVDRQSITGPKWKPPKDALPLNQMVCL